jgi:O-antigen/teichoic acid export membrane protein
MVMAGTKYTALLCWPVLAGLLIFGRDVLAVWVGPKYAAAYPVLVALTVPTFISLPQSVAGSVLYGVSRHRGVVALAVTNALLNLALSLWWVRSLGILGVALGTAVPLLLIQGVATAVYTARTLQLPAGRFVRDTVLVPALATLGFAIPATLIAGLWPPHTWGTLFVSCAGSWLGFAALAWWIAVDDRDRTRWGRMLRGLMGQPMTPPAGAEVR